MDYRPLSEAPRDSRDVYVLTAEGEFRAWYASWQWLRDRGEDVPDCYQSDERDDHIELDEVLGWRPA